jgi:hypothetical protein
MAEQDEIETWVKKAEALQAERLLLREENTALRAILANARDALKHVTEALERVNEENQDLKRQLRGPPGLQ